MKTGGANADPAEVVALPCCDQALLTTFVRWTHSPLRHRLICRHKLGGHVYWAVKTMHRVQDGVKITSDSSRGYFAPLTNLRRADRATRPNRSEASGFGEGDH